MWGKKWRSLWMHCTWVCCEWRMLLFMQYGHRLETGVGRVIFHSAQWMLKRWHQVNDLPGGNEPFWLTIWKENQCIQVTLCTHGSQRQWKGWENVTAWLLCSPAIIFPPVLCHCLWVYSRQYRSEAAARLMTPLLSLTFLTAQWTTRWHVSRAAPTYRPLHCFLMVPTHTDIHTWTVRALV